MIVVLGDGLLGSWLLFRHPKDIILLNRRDVDVRDSERLLGWLEDVEPDAVINCAGITKQNQAGQKAMREVNSRVPKSLASMCDLLGIKLIQVSTDCVFSGNDGQYTELSTPDPTDDYGRTKLDGEITEGRHLTVRTSFIGWPDPKGRGLLAWLHSNRGRDIAGYEHVWWNGFTAPALADILVQLAYDRTYGLMHLVGSTVSKFHLLTYINFLYGWNVRIHADPDPVLDRTLCTVRIDGISDSKHIYQQIKEMRAWETDFLEFQSLYLLDRIQTIRSI